MGTATTKITRSVSTRAGLISSLRLHCSLANLSGLDSIGSVWGCSRRVFLSIYRYTLVPLTRVWFTKPTDSLVTMRVDYCVPWMWRVFGDGYLLVPSSWFCPPCNTVSSYIWYGPNYDRVFQLEHDQLSRYALQCFGCSRVKIWNLLREVKEKSRL